MLLVYDSYCEQVLLLRYVSLLLVSIEVQRLLEVVERRFLPGRRESQVIRIFFPLGFTMLYCVIGCLWSIVWTVFLDLWTKLYLVRALLCETLG